MSRRRLQYLPVMVSASSIVVLLLATVLSAGGWGSDHGPLTTDHVVSFMESPPDGPRSPVPGSRALWASLLRDHLARYPLAAAEDAYKFVHQSVFGPAHAILSRDDARRYLDEELAALPPGPAAEPMLDLLSDDPALVRVNLRPFVAEGGDRERLLDAFVATASRVHGDPTIMRERLGAAVAVLRELGRAKAADGLAELAADMARNGYPAAHHSEAYRVAYRPAYRVVLRPLLEAGGLR
jgi:hypothetical protein